MNTQLILDRRTIYGEQMKIEYSISCLCNIEDDKIRKGPAITYVRTHWEKEGGGKFLVHFYCVLHATRR